MIGHHWVDLQFWPKICVPLESKHFSSMAAVVELHIYGLHVSAVTAATMRSMANTWE